MNDVAELERLVTHLEASGWTLIPLDAAGTRYAIGRAGHMTGVRLGLDEPGTPEPVDPEAGTRPVG